MKSQVLKAYKTAVPLCLCAFCLFRAGDTNPGKKTEYESAEFCVSLCRGEEDRGRGVKEETQKFLFRI